MNCSMLNQKDFSRGFFVFALFVGLDANRTFPRIIQRTLGSMSNQLVGAKKSLDFDRKRKLRISGKNHGNLTRL